MRPPRDARGTHPPARDTEQAADPVHGAPLPREELARRIGAAERRRARREAWQPWVLGAGLAALALGAPSERLWGAMDLARQTAGSGERTAGIVFPLAAALRHLVGLAPERACYLLAAVAYGLCVPSLARLLRGIGFAHGPTLIATSIAVASPLAWLGSTTPLDFAPGMLGATWLLAQLFQPRERVRSGYNWRAALGLCAAFLLRPENALLLPATLWAVARHRGRGHLTGSPAALVLALATCIPFFGLVSGSPERRALGWRVLDTLLAGRAPDLANAPLWIGGLVLGLSVAGLGVHSLLLGRRLPEETPAPPWIVPWCLVVLAPVVAGSPRFGPVGGYLIPAAAVGLADWLTRLEGDERPRRIGALLLAAQVLVTVLATWAWRAGDPLAPWRRSARAALDARDVVLSVDARHVYLARVRWGLESFVAPASGSPLATLPEALANAVRAGSRRLVLCEGARDGRSWPPAGEVLEPRVDAYVLDAGGIVRVPAGERLRAR